MNEAFIVDIVRTPRGKAAANGSLASIKVIDLLRELFLALGSRNAGALETAGDVVLGISSQIGAQGANLAKVAAIYAGLENCSGGTTNRFCCSGLDALAQAAMKIATGNETAVIAGGVEKCSEVGMFADGGAWFSDPEVSKKTRFVHMGVAADRVAAAAELSRGELDQYAVSSHARAAAARDSGAFRRSMVDLPELAKDELIRDQTTLEKLAALPPLFGGVHTIGTSPALADGAALALVSGSARGARAKIRACANAVVDPSIMLTGNIGATEKALARAGLTIADVDLFEVNESFAAIPLHYARHFSLDLDRVNVCGGAIALGHPLGATGVILTATVLDALEQRDGSIGVVSICGGAGLASAMVIERV